MPNGEGEVRVSTSDTKVRFTVASEGYFDSPGSTITFETGARDGKLYLKQHARAILSAPLFFAVVGFFESAKPTWQTQAVNFRRVLAGRMIA